MALDSESEGRTALRCRGLCKNFYSATSAADLLRLRVRGRRIDVLKGVDLQLQTGEILGVLGANGAGKSTLLKVVAGLLLPDAGVVEVLGTDLRRADAGLRQRVCYVLSEERSFSWRLSGRHNLEFFAALQGLRGKLAVERIEGALDAVGLGADADRGVREYSSGMRQRLALARGLLGSPQLFLFDEPTRGVDPLRARELREVILAQVHQGVSALIASHDPAEVQQLCDRVVLIEGGRCARFGDAAEAPSLWGLDR